MQPWSLLASLGLVLSLCGPLSAQSPPPPPPAPHLNLTLLTVRLAVCRLAPSAEIPAWAMRGSGFTSITRTSDELSLVVADGSAPNGTKCETGWRIFKLEGPFDFSLVGILGAVINPLRDAGISILSISTYDTDYVMVKAQNTQKAIRVLGAAGHKVAVGAYR